MSDACLDYFLFKVGKNLYTIESELEKLHYWLEKNGQDVVDEKLIDSVVYGQVEINAFLFLDYLLSQKDKAVSVLDTLHKNGSDEYQTL
jgi:DNA polymerase III delta subunit